MAVPDVRHALRVPGRLSISPSSLTSGSYPWGGTALGLTRGIVAVPSQANYIIRGEEYGGAPVDGVHAGEALVIVGRLNQWDATALGKLFPGVTTGATTQQPLVTGQATPGSLISDRGVVLLFTPDDVDHHPFVLLYNALPLVEDAARLSLNRTEDTEIGFAFHAVLDASSRLYQIGWRHDLTL